MSNIFNWHRFVSLFVRDFAENKRRYLYSLGILIFYFMILFLLRARSNRFELMACAIAGSFVTSFVVIWQTFKDYMQRRSEIPALLLPASVFEKCTFAWIQSLVMSMGVYWGIFLLINAGMGMFNLSVPILVSPIAQYDMFILIGLVHTSVVFITVAFRKQILGHLVFGACVLGFVAFEHLFFKGLFPGGQALDIGFLVDFRFIMVDQSTYLQYNINEMSRICSPEGASWILGVLFMAAMSIAGYYKLKERQAK